MKKIMRWLVPFFVCASVTAQTPELAAVVSKQVLRQVKLPGEFLPYETVELRARVPGFVERVLVDRGSIVRKGELLAELSAPEMTAQLAEAELKAQAAESQRAAAVAKLAAEQATYDRLKQAAQTPGAVAGNELIQAQKAVESAQAAAVAAENSAKAARAAVQASRDLESYLKVTAPFAGVITDRYVHPGALAGPATGPLLKIDQNLRLRLVVAVPKLTSPVSNAALTSSLSRMRSMPRRAAWLSRWMSQIRTGYWRPGCIPRSPGLSASPAPRCWFHKAVL